MFLNLWWPISCSQIFFFLTHRMQKPANYKFMKIHCNVVCVREDDRMIQNFSGMCVKVPWEKRVFYITWGFTQCKWWINMILNLLIHVIRKWMLFSPCVIFLIKMVLSRADGILQRTMATNMIGNTFNHSKNISCRYSRMVLKIKGKWKGPGRTLSVLRGKYPVRIDLPS